MSGAYIRPLGGKRFQPVRGRELSEEHQRKVMERKIEYAGAIYGFAAAYDNSVMVAGYVAFFALWAGVADDLHRTTRLVTVALMAFSLIVYLGWQIFQMMVRQIHEAKQLNAFAWEDDPARFNAAWDAERRRYDVAMNKAMRIYPWVFGAALISGFGAAAVLSYNAAAAVFGWPQLVGWGRP